LFVNLRYEEVDSYVIIAIIATQFEGKNVVGILKTVKEAI